MKNKIFLFLLLTFIIIGIIIFTLKVGTGKLAVKNNVSETTKSDIKVPYINGPPMDYIDSKAPQVIEQKVFERNIKLKYLNSSNIPHSKNGSCDNYNDENNIKYSFLHNTDFLCGFINLSKFNSSNSDNSKLKLTYEQMTAKAKNFLKAYIDLSKYTFDEIWSVNNPDIYYVPFYRKIKGYKTADGGDVGFSMAGEIVSYTARELGEFNNFNVVNFDESKINKNLDSQLKSEFGKKLVTYKILYQTLTVNQKNELEMAYDIKVELNKDYIDMPISKFYVEIN